MPATETSRVVPAKAMPPSRMAPLVHFVAWIGAIVMCLAFAGGVAWGISVVARPLFDDRLESLTADAVEPPPLPPAPTRAGDGTMVANPAWRIRPRPDYPRRAKAEGGSVLLECQVLPTGGVGACTILEETPPGQGFGDAAVRSARKASLYPRTVDGVATGGKIRFTVRFARG